MTLRYINLLLTLTLTLTHIILWSRVLLQDGQPSDSFNALNVNCSWWTTDDSMCSVHFIWSTTPPFLWGQQTFHTEIAHCFHGPSGVLLVGPYLVEHSSSSATALITDTQTVPVFAQGVVVCVTVTARALVTVLCYLCVFKCLFIIIIIITTSNLNVLIPVGVYAGSSWTLTIRCPEYSLAYSHVVTPLSSTPLKPQSHVSV